MDSNTPSQGNLWSLGYDWNLGVFVGTIEVILIFFFIVFDMMRYCSGDVAPQRTHDTRIFWVAWLYERHLTIAKNAF